MWSSRPSRLFAVLLASLVVACLVVACLVVAPAAGQDRNFAPLFNGSDFSGWIIPEGDDGHWRVVNGVIDYDALSQADGDKNLWTEEEFGDFVLRLDWRIKTRRSSIRTCRSSARTAPISGTRRATSIRTSVPDADSGVYLRGSSKAQVNIWAWPIGSGEVYGYRMDPEMPPAVVAGVTPRTMADNHIGEWNTFEITMIGERLTVVLNGKTVIDDAHLPGVPERGRIALQHHGHKVDGEWASSPSLVQFRNIAIKEL
jgi:hypothetical protein